jgi:hypothetical protein
MKDSKEGSENMKRKRPEWNTEIRMEKTSEDRYHTKGGDIKHDMERN